MTREAGACCVGRRDAAYWKSKGTKPAGRVVRPARLASIEAGNAFGELALLGDRPRTADVVAATPVTVLKLKPTPTPTRFATLASGYPAIHAKLLLAVGRLLADRRRRANTAIHVLSG